MVRLARRCSEVIKHGSVSLEYALQSPQPNIVPVLSAASLLEFAILK